MIINKLASSFALLVSLSLAAVASEKHDSPSPIDALASEPKNYLVKDFEVIRFDSSAHMQDLEKHLGAQEGKYLEEFKYKTQSLLGKQFFHVQNSLIWGGIALVATATMTSSGLIVGPAFFSAFIISMNFFPTYEKVKKELKSYVIEDLHNQKLVKIDNSFFSNESEQVFNQLIEKLTNQSTLK